MKNRLELAKYLRELGFKRGAEIGVYDGYNSEVLCKAIHDLKLICVDNYYREGRDIINAATGNLGVVKAVDEYVRKNGYQLQTTDWDRNNPVKDDRQPSGYFVKEKK